MVTESTGYAWEQNQISPKLTGPPASHVIRGKLLKL